MLCERCHQNKATLYINEYTQGKTKGLHLCNECAQIQGNIHGLIQPAFESFLSEILGIALGNNIEGTTEKQIKQDQVICPHCKMSANEFRKGGRFGCSICYETFDAILQSALKKIQPSNEHTGKVPRRLEPLIIAKREIKALKKELAKAIEQEEYETAAKLRDAIKELEKGGDGDE